MMILIVALAAATHAYMFGRWLGKNGNVIGAYAVYLIALLSVALPLYRYATAQ